MKKTPMKRTREDQYDPDSEVHLSSMVRQFLLEDEVEVRLNEEAFKNNNKQFAGKNNSFSPNNGIHQEEGKISEDHEYFDPHSKKKREIISSRRHLVRKIASLVRPTTKKMHVGLWKYVMAVKNSEKDNLKKGDKLKAYISKDAKLYTGNEAFKKCKEDKLDKTLLIDRFALGILTGNQSKLEYWGLPQGVIERFYKYTKITNLFEWQIELLKQDNVFSGDTSLVYFAPTSGGKSLPAELIMLHNIFVKQKRCVYILPFVSIVNEKTRYLRRICETSNVRIEPFWSQSESIWTPNVDIAVWTIEKANSLLNKVIEEGSYRLLDIFVFDELHMILDGHRGYQIEYILTKLKALEKLELERISEGKTWDGENISPSKWKSKTKKFQIIGMSATMGQSEKLEQWLECKIFESDYRPVPLSEYYVVNDVMFNSNHEEVFRFNLWTKTFNDRIKLLIETYFKYNKSVILFWNTKNACEKMAKSISSMVEESYEIQENMTDIVNELISASYNQVAAVPAKTKNLHIGRQEMLKRLSVTSVGLCDILKQTIKYGIAYHHSGLTDEERNIIENGYREGHLLLICATSTLSTGINLPAKAVIFNKPLIGTQLIDKTHYKQMSGRAGRTGFDTFGESIMLWDPSQKDHVQTTLLEADFSENILHSTIDQYTLRRAILEVIASTSVKSFREIGTFLGKLLKFELLEMDYWK
jgi:DNA polymerase theta